MTFDEALSEIEFLAAHENPARASELGQILRDELDKLVQVKAERDRLQIALAQAEQDLEHIRSARKTQRAFLAQARDALEQLMKDIGG